MLLKMLQAALLIVALGSLPGCSSSDRTEPTLIILEQPVVNDIPTAPLAKQLLLTTNLNANVICELVSDQNESFSILLESPNSFNSDARVVHDLTLLGLRPARNYTMTVTTVTDDGLVADANGPVMFSTDPLPADFPVITINTLLADQMEPTYTLMDTRKNDASAAYIVVLDGDGEVTWYFRPQGTSSTQLITDGNLLTIDETIGLIQEIDWRGQTATRTDSQTFQEVPLSFYSAIDQAAVPDSFPVDVQNFHDDAIYSSASLSYFSSAQNTQVVPNYPLDEFDPAIVGPANVLDEPLVEFNAAGTVLGTWNLLDILQPTRIGYDGTDGLPDEPADWVHVDSVLLDTSNNSLIATLRHQDAVIGFSRATGELLWIVGTPDNWTGFEEFLLTPTGEAFAWPFHPHAAEISGSGRLLMFDNGNRRASPFTGEPIVDADVNQSRAVEYTINLADQTITQSWEWGLEQSGESLYATTDGDADRLSQTGNTLITFGALCEIGGIPSDDIDICRTTGRVIEVDTETNARVFDVTVDSQPAETGYTVWRSERILTLYTNEPGEIVPSE
jgi:hypothetical protein